MADRSVLVRLALDVSGYTSGAQKAAVATRSVTDEVTKQSTAADKAVLHAQSNVQAANHKVVTSARSLGLAFAGVGAVAALGLQQVISAASDMNETVSKSRVVFGQQAGAVEKWADNSATAMGLSKQAAIEAAATFGNLFVSMKIGGPVAEDMSTRLVALAGDLASFNNTSPQDALEALRSGLVGEVEPLRRYGVNLNDAALRQEALRLGLKATGPTLDANVKAQAAYALILDQTKTAQGDFARTSSGLANSQRIAAAEFENTKAEIGAALLPAFNQLLHVGTSVLKFFDSLPGPMQQAVLLIGGLTGAALVLGPRLLAMRTALLEARAAQAAYAAATQASTVATEEQGAATLATTGRIGFAIGRLGRATALFVGIDAGLRAIGARFEDIGSHAHNLDETRTALDGLATSGRGLKDLANDGDTFANTIGQITDPGTVDRLNNFGAAVGDAFFGTHGKSTGLDQAKQRVEEIDKALADLASHGHADQAAHDLDLMDAALRADGKDVNAFHDLLTRYAQAQLGANAATAQLTLGTKAEQAAMKLTIPNLATMYDRIEAATLAQYDLVDAHAAAVQAAKDVGKSHEGVNDAMRTFITSADRARDAESNAALKNQAYRGELEKLRASTVPGSPLRKALDAFIARLDYAAKKRTAELLLKINVQQNLGEMHGADRTAAARLADAAASAAANPVVHVGPGHAHGGPVVGAGTGTSDSVALRASTGEWVMQTAAVNRYTPGFMHAVNAGTYAPLTKSDVESAFNAALDRHPGGDTFVAQGTADELLAKIEARQQVRRMLYR